MKLMFIETFGKHFDLLKLNKILNEIPKEEICYWYSKCSSKSGRKAFSILFDCKKRNNISVSEKETCSKIMCRALDGLEYFENE